MVFYNHKTKGAAGMKQKGLLKLGIVGLGTRGYSFLDTFRCIKNAAVVAVCDVYADRVARAAERVVEYGGEKPYATENYIDLLEHGGVDAVIVSTAWESHVEISCEAMERGIITGLEVGGTYSLDDCWKLVRTYERTGTPFMFLENCCFDRAELFATRLVREGILGEIVHASGAYAHDLRGEVFYGLENRHYRYRNYLMRNCDTYPTHELGPISKILGLHRGNRMVSLVSVASKASGLKAFAEKEGKPCPVFHHGDIINTIITCAGGETIALKLDTTLPTVYDRAVTVRGTKGLYMQTLHAVYLDGDPELDNVTCYSNAQTLLNNAAALEEKYLPSVWKNITEAELKAGHGGMDVIMMQVFVDHALSGEPMPIDVYDAAAWISVSCLSEQSVRMNGMPQAIPDFTGGKWLLRKHADVIDLA